MKKGDLKNYFLASVGADKDGHIHVWEISGKCEGEDNRDVYACDCGAQKDCDGGIIE